MAMRTHLHQDDERGPTTPDAPVPASVTVPLPPPRAAADHRSQSERRDTRSEGGDASLWRSGTDTAHVAEPDAASASPAASPPHSNRDPRAAPPPAQSQSRPPVAHVAAQRDHHPTIRTIESWLIASTGGAATATTSAASARRSTAAAALSHTTPLDQRPSVSVVAALSPCNQQSLHASPSSSSQSGSSSLLPPDPASAEAQAEAAWANPPSLPRPAPRSGRRLSDEGEEEVEEEGEITETRSSAQAAADYAAQMNPVADASFAAAPASASTPQHEAAAGDFAALARTGGGQAEQLSGWGSVTDIDAESGEDVAVSSPVDSAAGTAPGRVTSQGVSAADFGVGSTVLRRNVRGEFDIYTIRGLTNQGDKVDSRARGGRQQSLSLSCSAQPKLRQLRAVAR